ncbi:MAG: hypothetical protein WBF71_12440 [Microthrixaceae bacterium]
MNSAAHVATWIDKVVPAETVAPGLIEELRDFLDRRARAAVVGLDPALLPLRLPKSRLAALERCERMAVAQAEPSDEPEVPTDEMFKGLALDRFVVHQLTLGRVLDPVETLREMFLAEGEAELVDHIEVREEEDLDRLNSMLGPLATAASDGWSGIDPSWLPRTQSRALAVFDQGGVVCSGRLDVELGGGVTGLPGVVVEIKSGQPRSDHLAEMYYYALLVALRDRRAPGAMLCWYPNSAPLGAPVSAALLESVAMRIADSMQTWASLVGRSDLPAPAETSGAWCRWCPDADRCPSSSTTFSTASTFSTESDLEPDMGA